MTQIHDMARVGAAQQQIPMVHYMAPVPAGTPGAQATEATVDLVTRAREACRELFLGPRDTNKSAAAVNVRADDDGLADGD